MANVFGEKIDLRAGRFSIGPAAAHLAFAGHRPVILGHRHRFDHLRVEVIRKNAVGTASDEKARRLQAPFGRSPRRTGSSFQVTLIFPLSVPGAANLEMVLCCAMNKQGAAVSRPPFGK